MVQPCKILVCKLNQIYLSAICEYFQTDFVLFFWRSIRELKIEQDKLEEAKNEADRMTEATDMKPEEAVSTTTPLYRWVIFLVQNFTARWGPP